MNKEVAIERVEEYLLGEDSIPVQLRMRAGLDKEKFAILVEATEFLIEYYRSEDVVPKSLALAFVDISSYFFFKEGDYSEAELEEIEDAGILLTSLANQLFDSPDE